MARPIEYDKAEVLTNALEVFWRHGYDSASMKDLVKATGLSTRSMYDIFGSKKGLFQACLDWYYEVTLQNRYDNLIKDNGLTAIRNFIYDISGLKTHKGCFYVNTTSDRNNIDSSAVNIVDVYFRDIERIFKLKLDYAVEHEAYEGDPKMIAKQLVVLIKGISVNSKNIENLDENRRIAEEYLKLMHIS